MNPWKIIGWIVLGFLVLVMFSCYRAFAPRSPEDQARFDAATAAADARVRAAAPRYEFTITGVKCEERGSYTVMGISGRNSGSATIPEAKFFATVGGIPEDRYFSPMDIPPGALASADVMIRARGECKFVGIQAGGGAAVEVQTDLPK